MGVKLKFQKHTKFRILFFSVKIFEQQNQNQNGNSQGDFEQSLNNICFGRLHTSFIKHFCRQNGSV